MGEYMREIVLDNLPGDEEFATLARWYSEEGDQVFSGDDIADVIVKGKKITIQTPCSGVMSDLFFEAGDELEIGEVLAMIEDESEEIFEELQEKYSY